MAEFKPIPTSKNFKDLTGQSHGKWTVLGYWGKYDMDTYWRCRCECGRENTIAKRSLLGGTSKSCGKCRVFRGRRRKTPEEYTWATMKARCYNTNSASYQRYGGRGIRVCERWLDSFDAFLADMGMRPSKDHSINRIDNDGDYCPENCSWATKVEQGRNKSSNVVIEFHGKSQCLKAWADEYQMSFSLLWNRLFESKWSFEKAVTTPIRQRRRQKF